MGLTLCHNIAREHGGDLMVDSIPGAGTIFTVSLPVGEGTQDHHSTSFIDSNPLRVILVSSDITTLKHFHAAARK